MDDQKLLGEWADLAQWAGIIVAGLLILHVVRGKKWQEAHTVLGAAATGLFIASKL